MEYTLVLIDGDYAVLRTAEGLENRVARALLPADADEGSHLLWEHFSYELLKD